MPTPTVAPTPSTPYNPAAAVAANPNQSTRAPNPNLTAALNRHAGVVTTVKSEPGILPGQPPKSPLGDAAKAPPEPETQDATTATEAPAPHVKFITGDEEPSSPAPAASDAKSETPSEQDEFPQAPAQFREAFRKLKQNFAEKVAAEGVTKKELETFRAQSKSYQDRIKALESADARVKELEKTTLTLDEQLRVSNYLQHPEFHDKYVRPVAEAVQSASAMVKELMVEGESRLGNESDLNEVLSQPNYTLAAAKAAELFGERMGVAVFEEVKRIKQAQQVQSKAIKEAGTRSMEHLQRQQEASARDRTEKRSIFEQASKELGEKYAAIYLPPEGDKEAAEVHRKGSELASLILEGQPDGMDTSTYLQAVAKVHHRASAFPLMDLKLQRLTAERDQLKAQLHAYQKSTPDAEGRKAVPGSQDAGGVVVTGPGALEAKMHASLERRATSRR